MMRYISIMLITILLAGCITSKKKEVNQCDICYNTAKQQLKVTYKQSLKEMEIKQRQELKQLEYIHKKCLLGEVVDLPPYIPPVVISQPPVIDTVTLPSVELIPGQTNRFVCIGDNFPGTPAELHECVNDTNKWYGILTNYYKFKPEEVQHLTNEQCTSTNIKQALIWVFADFKPGDKRGAYISGHGAEDTDANGNIMDVIVTYDMISTNTWNASTEVTVDFWTSVLKPIPDGCNGLVILDTCHAGGAIRPLIKTGRTVKTIDGPDYVTKRVNAATTRRSLKATVQSYNCTFIAMCSAGQLSEESSETGGAGTNYLCESVKTLGVDTSGAMLASNTKKLLKANAFEQTPEAKGQGISSPLFKRN